MNHHEVLGYLKGEQSSEARSRLVDHIRSCDACRERVEEEQQFDQLLHHRLAYHKAPAQLLNRVREGLEQAAQRARRRRRPGAWVSSCIGATAAAAALVLVLVPAQPGALFHEGLVASGPLAAAVENLRGLLVCAGCARAGMDIELQQRCTRDEAHGHVTGLLDVEGRIWRFIESPEVAEIIADPRPRGRQVEMSVRPFSNIEYLRVYAVEYL